MIQNRIFSQEDSQTKASGHWPVYAIDLLSNLSPQPLYICLCTCTRGCIYNSFSLLSPQIKKNNKKLLSLLPLTLSLPQWGGKGPNLIQISCHAFSLVQCTEHPTHHPYSTRSLSTASSVCFWFYLLLLNISLPIKWIPPDYKYFLITVSRGFLTNFFLDAWVRDEIVGSYMIGTLS